MTTTARPHVAHTEQGAGSPTALFLPGWCGNRTVFDPVLARISDDVHCVSLDWRGHGESDPAADDFGLSELTDDAMTVIETTRSTTVVPVALSHAGWVAIELRRRIPELVPAIVFIDWMVLGPPPPFLRALQGLQLPDSWTEVRAALFAMWLTDLDNPALQDYVEDMGTYGFDMWARAGREIGRSFAEHSSPLAALDAMPEPPQVLHAYAQPDDPTLLEAQLAYAAEHPWFQVEKIDARSHFPMFEEPAALSARIEEFVVNH